MVVKTCLRVSHNFINIHKLVETIHDVFTVIKFSFVLNIEWLTHVKTVKPNLIWVDKFMPEVTFLSSRLEFNLRINSFDSLTILFFTCELVKFEKCLTSIYIINIVFKRVIWMNWTIFLNEVINKTICEFKEFLVALNSIKVKNCLNHTAVNIVPSRWLTALYFFNIPNRCLWCTFFQ